MLAEGSGTLGHFGVQHNDGLLCSHMNYQAVGADQPQGMSNLLSLGSCRAWPGDHRGLWGQLRAPDTPAPLGFEVWESQRPCGVLV